MYLLAICQVWGRSGDCLGHVETCRRRILSHYSAFINFNSFSYHILSLVHICFVLSLLCWVTFPANLSVCSGVCFSGRLNSPFLSKQPCEPEPSRLPLRQASPLPTGSASPVPAAGLSSLILLTQTDPFPTHTYFTRRWLSDIQLLCLCFGQIPTWCYSL